MKVLVVSSNSFSATRNNGKTMKMIFSEFSPKELCQFFVRKNGEVDFTVTNHYYLVSDKMAFLKILKPWKPSGMCISGNLSENPERREKEMEPIRIERTHFTQALRELMWLLSPWRDKSFWKWIDSQKPDVVFFHAAYSLYLYRVVKKINKRYNIPIVVYYTDDYVLYPPKNIMSYFLIKKYKEILCLSSLNYAIGNQMAEEYSQYFMKPFKAIMNIVPYSERNPAKVNEVVFLSYFGSLYYKRLEAIIQFAQFLHDCVKPRLNVSYRINIFTSSDVPDDIKEKANSLNVYFCGFLTGSNLQKVRERTDINLHVESSDAYYRRMTRLCISTKIPEYLMSYRPTVAFGPTEVASIKLLGEVDSRTVLSSDDIGKNSKEKASFMIELINNVDFRNEIAEKSYAYACNHFMRDKVAKEFRKDIENLLG